MDPIIKGFSTGIGSQIFELLFTPVSDDDGPPKQESVEMHASTEGAALIHQIGENADTPHEIPEVLDGVDITIELDEDEVSKRFDKVSGDVE